MTTITREEVRKMQRIVAKLRAKHIALRPPESVPEPEPQPEEDDDALDELDLVFQQLWAALCMSLDREQLLHLMAFLSPMQQAGFARAYGFACGFAHGLWGVDWPEWVQPERLAS